MEDTTENADFSARIRLYMERSYDAAEDPNRLPRCNAGDVHDTGSASSYMEAVALSSDMTARQEQLVDDPEADDEMQPPP